MINSTRKNERLINSKTIIENPLSSTAVASLPQSLKYFQPIVYSTEMRADRNNSLTKTIPIRNKKL